MSTPDEIATLWSFQPAGDTGWFVTYADDDPAPTLPVAGWGSYAGAGYSAVEPMVPDGPNGALVRARDLGVVVNLEWKEGGA